MSTFLRRFRWRLILLLSVVGPGLITAVVDNDSGGIATYSLAGAVYGFDLLWTLIPITVLLIVTMEMSARLGAVTGQGLADLLRERFGVKVTFWMLLAVFFANFGTVISEFSGIGASIDIFMTSFGYPELARVLKFLIMPLLTYGIWRLITEFDYKKIEKFFLLSIFFYLAYPISAYLAGPDWSAALKALVVPVWRFDAGYFFTMIGVIGTTITPWMQFYLQSTLIEKGVTVKNLRETRVEVSLGCIMTDVISFFIIVACAVTLCFNKGGPIPVQSIEDIGKALIPLSGSYSGYLFAFGLFNASLFGAAILPLSTAFAICEGLGFERGMNKTYEEAPAFYGIFSALLIIGTVLVLVPGFSFFYLWAMRISQVAQGLILPPFLYFLVKLSDDKNLLGEHANPRWLSLFSWFCFWVLTIINVLLLGSTLKELIVG